ncbi:2-oxoglutarate dehydrogenase complex dihydrolipoyllysine-residue succinyltransferase [Permianibacter aggregans]|uniref:Dihydrolipoyllysine-residue succinyltransferase component of 2-oxoglutarate dehydrogenase complex n=1 Tax=Permianibacter aggregans TaxID=1510150 RepID=A0A4R6UJQ1_9GAMM|nr:2-oxoglutarate dehydrogenase complex dihydrolipoyllysine-residue succinyltransferase [Permianibacter aggregans]QGX38429.1 2-oxoglutarate dehydrogenase complex dihydrolipoyllysine-residue succinyltransferase [Permianibacter aggregans]TDQ45543.1 2-oxoglutarate dehydrogenase E2 component [Permianibacter aggregans]
MSIEIKVPVLPESVAEATIATWHKKPGESVKRDEVLVDIETDKVVLEVSAPDDGVIEEILKDQGSTVGAEEVIAKFKKGGGESAKDDKKEEKKEEKSSKDEDKKSKDEDKKSKSEESSSANLDALSPAVRRLVAEHNLDASKIKATGKDGRLTKEDVENHIKGGDKPAAKSAPAAAPAPAVASGEREERRVPMTRLRQRIAERLLQAQHNAAILTTFNDINMKPVMELRAKYKDQFEKTHGVKLGFMSFFVKAATEALKRYPEVNASIDGNDIVYHGYYDIGVAVSAPRGLVVPVLRDTDRMSMADVEKTIGEMGQKAKNNSLTVEEMTGGTFTISNGGVFGSLMATPIINPPQSAILGMFRTEDRVVAVNGQIVIQPMMYVALSYDHRIIDGRESVGFLKTIKEFIEDPARLLLNV